MLIYYPTERARALIHIRFANLFVIAYMSSCKFYEAISINSGGLEFGCALVLRIISPRYDCAFYRDLIKDYSIKLLFLYL
jgi:hypothetical protein